MLVFGEFLFLLIFVGFLLLQSALIYFNQSLLSLFSLVLFLTLGYFFIEEFPNIDYRLLIAYPVLALGWMAGYWYLFLIRTNSRIKNIIKSNPDKKLEYLYDKYSIVRENTNVKSNFSDELKQTIVYKIDIKNPHKMDIFSNGLMFPVSIPVFFLNDFIRLFQDFLYNILNKVRERLSESLNEQFKQD